MKQQKTSRSAKAALMALGIIDAQAMFIRNVYLHRPNNKTVLQLCRQVTASAEAARRQWPGNLTQREVDIMQTKLKRYLETHLPIGETLDAPVLTSIALGLLDNLHSHVRGNQKEGPVSVCITKVRRLHGYFDRKLDKFKLYDLANKKVNAYHQEVELWT